MPSGLRAYSAQVLCYAAEQPVGIMGQDGRECHSSSEIAVQMQPTGVTPFDFIVIN